MHGDRGLARLAPHARERGVQRRRVGQIAVDVEPADFGRDRRALAIEHGDARAVRREPARDRGADAAPAARDHSDAPVERTHEEEKLYT